MGRWWGVFLKEEGLRGNRRRRLANATLEDLIIIMVGLDLLEMMAFLASSCSKYNPSSPLYTSQLWEVQHTKTTLLSTFLCNEVSPRVVVFNQSIHFACTTLIWLNMLIPTVS
jgi:hypothetical protein